jgi:vacuolar-type H+-ATPase subunit F/Vma7
MTAPVFIGDEISAAGFRLAGVRIRTPEAEEIGKVLEWAGENACFIIITEQYLNLLLPEQRQRYLRQVEPPLVVVPDIRGQHAVRDLATHLRAQLGVLE